MNLTFGNLATLKLQLLPESFQNDASRDPAVEALGRGVAGIMETYCDRKFARTVGAVEYFERDKEVLVLARYPVEAKPVLALRGGQDDTWQTYTETIAQWSPQSGIITLNGSIGDEWSLIRATYTGGYWIDVNGDGLEAMPAAATLMPYELERAWLEQCKFIWNAGQMFVPTGTDQRTPPLTTTGLLPLVRQTLDQYRRITV